MYKKLLIISSTMMAFGISIGAFGAHGLKPYLDTYALSIFQKGVSYHFYNTLGLFTIAFSQYIFPTNKKIKVSFFIILIGTLIFSLSLYVLALSKILLFGAIVPIGGVMMIVGWILFSYTLYKEKN
jgi:uncharacterized membrane protein YgdD (TMEM256/DUF423 family)